LWFYNLYESNRQAGCGFIIYMKAIDKLDVVGCVMYHYLAHTAHEIESFAAVVEVSKI